MIHGNYLPDGDQPRKTWLDNFNLKLPTHSGTLGITVPQQDSVKDDTKMWAYILGEINTFTAEKEERVEYKNLLRNGDENLVLPAVPGLPLPVVAPTLVKAGIFKRIGKLVQTIKNHSNYTESIGQDLQIIGAEQVHNPDDLKPVITGHQTVEGVKIGWKKLFADSQDFYVDRDGNGFVYLANDTHPPYIDTATVPAGAGAKIWKYKSVYKIGDKQVGLFGDPIEVTVREN